MASAGYVKAVKDNIMSMVAQGATQNEVDMYRSTAGLTKSDMKANKNTLSRSLAQTLGGAVGGALASPGALTTPLGIGLGSSMAGQGHDLMSEFMGKKNTEPLLDRSMESAQDVMLDTIMPKVLGSAAAGAKNVVKSGLQKFKGMASNIGMQEYLDRGLKPTAATVTQSKGLGAAENALKGYFFSAGPLQKNAEHNLVQLIKGNKLLAERYGPILSKGELGLMLKGVKSKIKGESTGVYKIIEAYDAAFSKMYDRLGRQIGGKQQPIENTLSLVTELVQKAEQGPESKVVGLISKIVKKAETNDGLTFEALKNWRSQVGEMMKDPVLRAGKRYGSKDLKMLYGSLSEDMKAAASTAGKADEWSAINNYFKSHLEKDIPILEEIIKKLNPDEILDSVIMKSTAKGGFRLNTLKKNLPKEQWDTVAGTVLGKMGTMTNKTESEMADWSSSTFMNNWIRLSDSAKKTLFEGTKHQSLWKELDTFSKITKNFKGVRDLANTSHTGSVLGFYSIMGAIGGATGYASGGNIVGGALTLGTMSMLPHQVAKLMTNQRFVRWLSTGVRLSKSKPNSMPVHMGRLMALRFKDDIQPYVDTIIDNIVNPPSDNVASQKKSALPEAMQPSLEAQLQ